MTRQDSSLVPDCYQHVAAQATRCSSGALVVTLGEGPRGVVMVPISWEGACQWKAQAIRLAQRGYHVASLSWGENRARSLREAVRVLQRAGVTGLVLVGACAGGTAALDQATQLASVVRGVVAVSPLVSVAGISVGADFANYAGPVLLVGTTSDPLTPASVLLDIDRVRPIRSQVVIFPGEEHGVDIMDGPRNGADAVRRLDTFLSSALPS